VRVDLKGREAVVTGEGDLLGDAIADCLRANGAQVARAGVAADILVVLPGAPVQALCQDAAVAMRARRTGRIVLVGSVTGIVPVRGRGDDAADSAGLFAWMRSFSLELAGQGVLVNAIATDRDERLVSHTPLGRVASPAEIAQAALFLVAPDNSYMTGHVLVVDGGWSAGFARDF
jgi:NAD(P)-dependent dehydrogenase (short-subunit alcohol dehydrogenase family)